MKRSASGEYAHRAQETEGSILDLWNWGGKLVNSEDSVGRYVAVGTTEEVVNDRIECQAGRELEGVASYIGILVAEAAGIGEDDDAGTAVGNVDDVERPSAVSVVDVVVVVADALATVVGQHAGCNRDVASHYRRGHYGNNYVAEVSAEPPSIHGHSFEELHEAKAVSAEYSLVLHCHC